MLPNLETHDKNEKEINTNADCHVVHELDFIKQTKQDLSEAGGEYNEPILKF